MGDKEEQEDKKEQKEKRQTEERQIVIFAIGQEEFGVNVREVREIIRMEQITPIPNTQEFIKGVINLRGSIVVVVDLAKKLGLPVKEATDNTRIIVIDVNENTLGMIVDSATEVLRLNSNDIKSPPEVITRKINANYIEGVGILGERLLILLNLAKMLEAKEIEHVAKIQQQSAAQPKTTDQNTQADATQNQKNPSHPEATQKEIPLEQTTPDQATPDQVAPDEAAHDESTQHESTEHQPTQNEATQDQAAQQTPPSTQSEVTQHPSAKNETHPTPTSHNEEADPQTTRNNKPA